MRDGLGGVASLCLTVSARACRRRLPSALRREPIYSRMTRSRVCRGCVRPTRKRRTASRCLVCPSFIPSRPATRTVLLSRDGVTAAVISCLSPASSIFGPRTTGTRSRPGGNDGTASVVCPTPTHEPRPVPGKPGQNARNVTNVSRLRVSFSLSGGVLYSWSPPSPISAGNGPSTRAWRGRGRKVLPSGYTPRLTVFASSLAWSGRHGRIASKRPCLSSRGSFSATILWS